MPVGYRFRSERNALMKQSLVTERILSYVGKNLESAMTLDTIAKELHYSKFYLERTFKKDMGISLYQYIRRRRLNEAAEKLGNTDRPVIEIALEAGYLSQQAFAQAFRDEYGCTPLEYRKNRHFVRKKERTQMNAGVYVKMREFRFQEGRMAA